jgi:hypothetical protein
MVAFALRIEVDHERARAEAAESGRQIDGRRRLADAALLIRDAEDAHHQLLVL